jgi:hypothetical protein
MSTANNAIVPASSTTPHKNSRKSSNISKSPHRPFNANEEDWPALEVPIPPSTPINRSQGTAKRGKTNQPSPPALPSQRKLDAFFALAKQSTLSSPPRLSSLGATCRTSLLPSVEKRSTPNKETAQDGSGKAGTACSDPPVETATATPSKLTGDSESDEDYEPPLSNIKLRPKTKRTPAKISAKKQRKTSRASVGFDAEPTEIQIVEPEEPPAAAKKVDHPFRTIVTATVRVDKVKDSLGNFIDKLANTVDFLRKQVDAAVLITSVWPIGQSHM